MSIYSDAQTLQTATASAAATAASTQATADATNASLFASERAQLVTAAGELASIPGMTVTYPASGDSVLVATLAMPAAGARAAFTGVLNLAVIAPVPTNPPTVPAPEPTFQFQLLWARVPKGYITTEEVSVPDYVANSNPATNLYAGDITSFRALLTAFVAANLL
jgi:hypothetical protein